MKKVIPGITALLLFFIGPDTSLADILTAPRSIAVARGSQAAVTVTYKISTSNPGDNHTLGTSNFGEIKSGGTSLGRINNPVSASLKDSGGGLFGGTAAETIIISSAVLKKAEQNRISRFQYKRTFTLSGGVVPSYTLPAVVEITVKAAGGVDFKITALKLYFENNKGDITVKQGKTPLKVFADLQYTGAGLLQGYWKVDNRLLAHIKRHLVPGPSITLELPGKLNLPTSSAGTHVVHFVITGPQQEGSPPKALYYVTAGEMKEAEPVILTAPEDSTPVDASKVLFKWQGINGTVTFLIEFVDDSGEKPIFSAFTEGTEYAIPPAVLKYSFLHGKTYFWRVKAFDSDHNVISKSPMWKFTVN